MLEDTNSLHAAQITKFTRLYNVRTMTHQLKANFNKNNIGRWKLPKNDETFSYKPAGFMKLQ